MGTEFALNVIDKFKWMSIILILFNAISAEIDSARSGEKSVIMGTSSAGI